ncbi:MAG: NAD(P)-dependent oxidoreductase [Anaerolineales bacterium]|nr:NAD(P)-dependent oxidoreductase [Anaerolineales bacterium]
MHVLVTGGLGHIGSQLIRYLSDNSRIRAITILDNLSTQRYASLFDLPKNLEYTFVKGDILDSNDLSRAMSDVDSVVHLAAITNAEGSFDISEQVQSVNLGGTKNVLQSCIQHGVKSLVFPSTTSVYGPVSGIAREDCDRSDLKPQSPYATSKLAAEEEVISATERGDIRGVILRLGTIFGPSIGMRFHTAVNKFIFYAATGRSFTVWSEAVDLVRPYLALEDGVAAIEFVLSRPETTGQIYNVVTLNSTIDQIINEVRSNFPAAEIEYTRTRLLNQVSYHVDDSKIRALGFSYRGNLNSGIRETVEWLSGLKAKKL